MSKFTQLECDRERNEIWICLTSQALFLSTTRNHLPFFLFTPSLPSTEPLAKFPACTPKSLWLVIAGWSLCQVNVSNQSPSPGCEKQAIRTVSRCLTTRRQPEWPSAVFSLVGWALANVLREAPCSTAAGRRESHQSRCERSRMTECQSWQVP